MSNKLCMDLEFGQEYWVTRPQHLFNALIALLYHKQQL